MYFQDLSLAGPCRALRGVGVAVVSLVSIGLTGCLALSLSSRGAPDAEMRQFVLRMEAVDVAAGHEGAHVEALVLRPLWAIVPASGWLHGFEIRLLDADGDSVPSEVLHHFKVMDPHRRELFSPVALHLAGGGAENKPVSLPRQAGVPFEKGDSLLVTAMLHNPTGRPIKGVRLEITMRYSPQGSWEPPLSVTPFFTHVTEPMQEPDYDLPPGVSEQSIDISPAVPGWIIGLGGHLHRYGVLLRLEDVTEGRVLWEKEPIRSLEGDILEVPFDRFVRSRGPKLLPDHTYRVTAVYDNPTGVTIPDGGMGTLGGAFVTEEPWPAVDPQAAEYRWYMARELSWSGTQRDPP